MNDIAAVAFTAIITVVLLVLVFLLGVGCGRESV